MNPFDVRIVEYDDIRPCSDAVPFASRYGSTQRLDLPRGTCRVLKPRALYLSELARRGAEHREVHVIEPSASARPEYISAVFAVRGHAYPVTDVTSEPHDLYQPGVQSGFASRDVQLGQPELT
nr:hypothetical protein [Actinopolyspora xinjiangensis]